MESDKIIKNKRVILSTLWIFVTLNYLYCDLVGLMDCITSAKSELLRV